MLLLILTVTAVTQTTVACITNYGQTACGYHCLAAHGEVDCAQTPAGICSDVGVGVACWDPPEWVRAHYGASVPPPECRVRNGSYACGYRCVAHGDEVACAQTPDGICDSSSRGITCWDPEPSTYCSDERPLPRPMCIMVDGRIACGYACEARAGRMACAATPGGRCEVQPTGIYCADPAPPPMCGARPCRAERGDSARAWCRRSERDEDKAGKRDAQKVRPAR